ncbi:hypothetical protein ABKN59_007937 [Abortiporus biennis]
MMSWMGPQQYQSWFARPAPSGWVGSWPPPAPTAGPPPPPPGVDASRWVGGQWQFNPSYRPVTAAVPAAAWAPHPGWGPAAAAAYNPHKRIPNKGDYNYWNTKLVDNPLGLENMHIRSDDPKFQEMLQTQWAKGPPTPWVWAPPNLHESPEQEERPLNGRNGRDTRETRQYSQSQVPQGISSASAQAANTDLSRSQSYRIYNDNRAPSSSEPRRERRDSSMTRSGGVLASAPATVTSFGRMSLDEPIKDPVIPPLPPGMKPPPRDVERERRPSGYTQQSATSTSSQSTRRSGEHRRDAAFTSHQDLQPTFSPKIVRTPAHYPAGTSTASAAAAAHAASRNDTQRTPSNPVPRPSNRDNMKVSPSRSNTYPHIYGPPTVGAVTPTRSSSNSSSSSERTTPLRQSSMPQSSSSSSCSSSTTTPSHSKSTTPNLSYLHGLSEEPEGSLSPLVVASAPRTPDHAHRSKSHTSPGISSSSHSRELSRSATYPLQSNGQFASIPEEYSSTSSSNSTSTSHASSSDSDHSRTVMPRTPGHSTAYQQERSPNTQGRGEPRGTPLSRSHTAPTSDYYRESQQHSQSPYPSPSHQGRPRAYSPPPSGHRRVYSASRGSSPSPHDDRMSRNPLPPPPKPSPYPTTPQRSPSHAHTHSHSQSMSTSQRSPHYSSAQSPYAPYVPSHTSTASQSIPTSSTSTSATHQRRRVRAGYWNRRGDHLYIKPSTTNSPPKRYIVYAPSGQVDPPELASYPAPTEGFMNHHGDLAKYDPNIPELPESLPRHGQNPEQPYEDFVQYCAGL